MNLIRKLKISDIVPIEFTKQELEIVNLFNDKLSDLIIFINESYPDEINYMKPDGSWIMQQDNKYDRLWIRYDGFWEVLESKFCMEYTDIQNLIQAMVERAFKHKVSTPVTKNNIIPVLVERAFKHKVSTPNSFVASNIMVVERAYKLKVSI